jgi:hypothetical protein
MAEAAGFEVGRYFRPGVYADRNGQMRTGRAMRSEWRRQTKKVKTTITANMSTANPTHTLVAMSSSRRAF